MFAFWIFIIRQEAKKEKQVPKKDNWEQDIIENFIEVILTNFKDLGSNITVINIQDLHCHLQTQKNINEILSEYLNDQKIVIESEVINND